MKKRILSILLTLCMVLMLVPATAFAMTYGDFEYSVNENNEVTIDRFNNTTATSVDIPASIGNYPVKYIGYIAFSDRTNLTSITIPNSIISIGERAFNSCRNLENITIPEGVISIGKRAFTCCYSLESITISNTVKSIGEAAFDCCKSLKSITIPNSVTSIEDHAFYKSGLESITIPNSVTSIGTGVFLECTSLKSITIPSSVTSIGESAFWKCTSLKSITIPSNVTSIGIKAFYQSGLESITIPSSVTSIGMGAFWGCTSLESIFLPAKDNLSIDKNAIPNETSKVYYSLDTDKREVTITKIDLGTSKTTIDIPATINGYPVVAVAAAEQGKVGAHKCAGDTATCLNPQTCSICGKYFSHSYTKKDTTIEGALKTAGTCTTEAVYNYSCIYCDLVEKDDNHIFTGAKDPDNHAGTKVWEKNETQHKKYWSCCDAVVVDYEDHTWNSGVCSECNYTCTHKDEKKDHLCDICGVTVSGHTGGTATCTNKAVCEYCGEEYGKLDSSNHTGSKVWKTTETQHKQYWDCCDAVVVDYEDHTWNNGVCSVCGYPCSHDYDSVVTPPTCTESGYTTHTCANCGNSYVDSEVPATGHSFKFFKCVNCGMHYGCKGANCVFCSIVRWFDGLINSCEIWLTEAPVSIGKWFVGVFNCIVSAIK